MNDQTTETDEQRADREETERDHARGDHTHCGLTCETELPTEHLRNFVIAKGYPGTKGALAELERRAAAKAAPVADLRDRIAAALYDHSHPGWALSFPDLDQDQRDTYLARADAVLAVLPAPADQTAERPLSPFYEHPECGFRWHGRDGMDIPIRDGQPVCPRCELAKVTRLLEHTSKRREEVGAECKRRGKQVLEQSERILTLERQVDEVQRQLGSEILRAGQAEAELRRVADETTATETPEWDRPETEEEKLAKCRRMAKAMSAPPVAPPEWETTAEWPDRHKRPGDRRVHATARFIVNDTQRFWTACGEHVGSGGTPMSHMPVNCRGCKRATAAGARQDGAQR
ncbi:hypothetical protein [Streptomyces sp. NPDC044948]|uniref:hypothetical protein n=1 Tax=Streptomyces sp. NPDC044948 TaxID=3157092 RepID=UPI0033DE5C23